MGDIPDVNFHAPSPAPSHEEVLDEGFQHLQDFNKSVDAKTGPQYYPDPTQYHGHIPDSDHTPSNIDVGLHLHDYRYPEPYDNHIANIQHQGQSPYSQTYQYSTPPLTTTIEDPFDGIRTRSGRSLGSGSSPTGLKGLPAGRIRDSRSPRVKKAKTPKTDKANYPKLDMVLSELVKMYPDIEAEEMEAYVRRDPADRQRKAQEKKRATPPRPMNSFMLYRHCYAETIKRFLEGKGNHQQVSAIAGKSWGNESDELRGKFQEYADMEKENHKKAFPNYHFKPKKDQNVKKRKNVLTDDEDEPSDLDDFESWGTPGSRSSNTKRQKRIAVPSGHGQYQQQAFFDSRRSTPQLSINRSSFTASNPSGIPPASYPHPQPGMFLQRTIVPYLPLESVQDIRYVQEELPNQAHANSGMIALPGADHQDLLYPPHLHHEELPMIDPSLDDWAAAEIAKGEYNTFIGQTSVGVNTEPGYHGMSSGYYHEHQGYQYPMEGRSHPGEQTLTDAGQWSLQGGDFLDHQDTLGLLDEP